MKKWCLLLALLLAFLTGCRKPTESTPQTNPSGTEATEPTKPGIYDGENPIETATNGAVKAFRPESGTCLAIVPVGEDLLLFEENTLSLLTGENLVETLSVELNSIPLPGSGMIQIQSDGVAYYDSKSSGIVFLNRSLEEVGCLQLSEEPVGAVYLTADWNCMYYCTEGGIRALDTATGVSRTLKAHSGKWQGISGCFLDESLLRCHLEQPDGSVRTLLISAKTGETVAEGDYFSQMAGGGNLFFLQKKTGSVTELIFGWGEGELRTFQPLPADTFTVLSEDNAVLTVSSGDGVSHLDYYSLVSGHRVGAVELPDLEPITLLYAQKGIVWFSREGILFRWDTAKSPVEDSAVYTAPRQTLGNLEEGELPAFAQQLQVLEQRYGLAFLYGELLPEWASPESGFEEEYLVQAYQENLPALEAVLGNYPEGFFARATQWTKNGKLQILLLRSIRDASGEKVPVVRYLKDGEAYLALALGEWSEEAFFLETAHFVDMKVLSSCTSFDTWEKLNPKGFRYGSENGDDPGNPYLQDESRYFVNTYAMTSPVADRVSVLQYALMPENDGYFAAKTMQAKLKTLCKGIRKAFGLKGESYHWEQYLQS